MLFMQKINTMTLELAESRTQIPVRNTGTNEIVLMNAEAFAQLAPVEMSTALEELPVIFDQMQNAGVIDQNTRLALENESLETVNQAQQIMSQNIATTPLKWSGSFNIEPSPKPWFARPEVLLPLSGVAILALYLVFRKK